MNCGSQAIFEYKANDYGESVGGKVLYFFLSSTIPNTEHTQEVVLCWCHWAVAECALNIQLGHECTLAQMHTGVHNNSGVVQGEVGDVNPVVDAVTRGKGERCIINRHFPECFLGTAPTGLQRS